MATDGALAGAESTLADFFQLLEIEARDAHQFPNAMQALRDGRLQGIMVHRVIPGSQLAETVANLEAHRPRFIKTWFPDAFRSWFYGCNLNLTPPELTEYFTEAVRFNEQLRQLTRHGRPLDELVRSVLSCLDAGKPYAAPPGPLEGQQYMFTTFRAHETGGFIPQHFDNEQALRPSYRHLMELIEPQLASFVLSLAEAESGGELEIYNQAQAASADAISNDDGAAAISPNPSTLRSVSFRIPPGAMLIVDSGRLLHSVNPTAGLKRRWVACSFMAESRDRKAVYCWG